MKSKIIEMIEECCNGAKLEIILYFVEKVVKKKNK